jgi:hypothetical protein
MPDWIDDCFGLGEPQGGNRADDPLPKLVDLRCVQLRAQCGLALIQGNTGNLW